DKVFWYKAEPHPNFKLLPFLNNTLSESNNDNKNLFEGVKQKIKKKKLKIKKIKKKRRKQNKILKN
ncbi:unnamed protein product, partial [marine sediment metagenome]